MLTYYKHLNWDIKGRLRSSMHVRFGRLQGRYTYSPPAINQDGGSIKHHGLLQAQGKDPEVNRYTVTAKKVEGNEAHFLSKFETERDGTIDIRVERPYQKDPNPRIHITLPNELAEEMDLLPQMAFYFDTVDFYELRFAPLMEDALQLEKAYHRKFPDSKALPGKPPKHVSERTQARLDKEQQEARAYRAKVGKWTAIFSTVVLLGLFCAWGWKQWTKDPVLFEGADNKRPSTRPWADPPRTPPSLSPFESFENPYDPTKSPADNPFWWRDSKPYPDNNLPSIGPAPKPTSP